MRLKILYCYRYCIFGKYRFKKKHINSLHGLLSFRYCISLSTFFISSNLLYKSTCSGARVNRNNSRAKKLGILLFHCSAITIGGHRTASSTGYFVTHTFAKIFVLVTSLSLQRHNNLYWVHRCRYAQKSYRLFVNVINVK
jgi:nitrous oxidase accessory protein NosD